MADRFEKKDNRLPLNLPDSLKLAIFEFAAQDDISANDWIRRQLQMIVTMRQNGVVLDRAHGQSIGDTTGEYELRNVPNRTR